MQKVNTIRAFTVLTVAFLLFASIVSSAFTSPIAQGKQAQVITRKSDATPSGCLQFPFEQKEKEEENGSEEKSRHTLFFICLITHTLLPTLESTTSAYLHTPTGCGSVTGLPLYLAKRSLII